MVRKSRKRKERKKCLLAPEADLSVSNFADSPDKRFRIKKSDSSNFNKMAKTAIEPEDIPDNWFDREEDEELVTKTKNLIITTSPSPTPGVSSRDKFTLYPLDFWYILSKYISPEEVGTFSLICKSSYSVVSGQSFWRSLYNRYFDPVAHNDLPVRLLPDCMSRPKGLRAGVIKMLHMTYLPFLERQGKENSMWPDPHLLTGKVCVMNWSNKVARKSAYYYFKLKDNVSHKKAVRHCDSNDAYAASDEEDDGIGDSKQTKQLIDELSDITYNPEDGCSILQIVGNCWSSIPPVMGLKLLGVTLSVSHGMRFHKLKLLFGSPLSDCRRTQDQQETTQVLIDSVCGMKVLNWWSPQYPREGMGRPTQHYVDHFGN